MADKRKGTFILGQIDLKAGTCKTTIFERELTEQEQEVIDANSSLKPSSADVGTLNGHALERTSPKGERFLGKCIYCGRENLAIGAALAHCDSPIHPGQEKALLSALTHETKASVVTPADVCNEAENESL